MVRGLKNESFLAVIGAILFAETTLSAEPIFHDTEVVEFESVSYTTLKVFPGAYHLFDHPGIDIVEMGHVVRSDPDAAAQAIRTTREFLSKML